MIIGIGSGNPDHLTGEAVRALNQVEVFLVADKGGVKRDLVELRTQLCRSVIGHDRYRVVEVPDPDRGPDADRTPQQYGVGVRAWHDARAQAYAKVIRAETGPAGVVGFLVWGDPAFYDSTIRIVESVAATGLDLAMKVIPGISSIQLLAAAHRIVLNRIGRPVHLTTGRRLLAEYSPALGDVVVVLDADLTCAGLVVGHPHLQVFWGAQLGLPDETLVAGPLAEVVDEIRERRAALRAARGWVMDTYLLRPGTAS